MNNGIYVVAKGQGYLANININRFEPLPQTLVGPILRLFIPPFNLFVTGGISDVMIEFRGRANPNPKTVPRSELFW